MSVKISKLFLSFVYLNCKDGLLMTSRKYIIENNIFGDGVMNIINRIPTGVPGLDELIENGLPKKRSFLVSGATGSGKTIFSMQFLYQGAYLYGEPGIYVTLDERPELIREDMLKFGWNIKRMEDEKKVVLFDATVSRLGIDSGETTAYSENTFDYKKLLLEIIRAVKETNAKRIVIDSIATLGIYFDGSDHIREAILEMIYVFSKLGLTALLVSELESSTNKYSKYGVEEYVADGVFVLKYLDTGIQGINRTLLIRKMRATKHSSEIHPMEITDNGIVVKNIDDYNL
ncbi:MAG: ATPase [Candidatus Diapherotrites archaeon CG08_land_8_20_14_0_20_30_16]|nr:MAG: ATPase [Candidatus Diapherotrites archaeon CG08_land_8_20_14_0_20_30_16]